MRPWAHVAFHSTDTGFKIATKKKFVFPNGITGPKPDPAGLRQFQKDEPVPGPIFVASYDLGQILAFERSGYGELNFSDKVQLNSTADNLMLSDPPTDLLVAGHPSLPAVMAHATDLEEKITCSSVVSGIKLGTDGKPLSGEGSKTTEWLVDSVGDFVNTSTTAWADLKKGDLVVSGLVGRGILHCKGFAHSA